MFPTWYEYAELGRPGAAAVQRVDPGPMYLAVKPATVYVVGCLRSWLLRNAVRSKVCYASECGRLLALLLRFDGG